MHTDSESILRIVIILHDFEINTKHDYLQGKYRIINITTFSEPFIPRKATNSLRRIWLLSERIKKDKHYEGEKTITEHELKQKITIAKTFAFLKIKVNRKARRDFLK